MNREDKDEHDCEPLNAEMLRQALKKLKEDFDSAEPLGPIIDNKKIDKHQLKWTGWKFVVEVDK